MPHQIDNLTRKWREFSFERPNLQTFSHWTEDENPHSKFQRSPCSHLQFNQIEHKRKRVPHRNIFANVAASGQQKQIGHCSSTIFWPNELSFSSDFFYKSKFKNHRMSTALVAKSILNNYGDRVSRIETLLKYSNQNKLNTHILPVIFQLIPIHWEYFFIRFFSFSQKIDQLEKRINFIEQRFQEIQNSEWKGGLKRPLLW